MTERPRRPGALTRQQLRVLLASFLSTVLVASIGLAVAIDLSDRGEPADVAEPVAPEPFRDDEPASVVGAGPCITVAVRSSLENAALLERLGAAYADAPRSVDGRCVEVVASSSRSGVAAADASAGYPLLAADERPIVWVPDSSSWLDVARAAGVSVVPDSGQSLATSNVVLAMPEDLADAIGWSSEPPSWSEIFDAAEDSNLWADLGHPEWGTFKLGKTSPIAATSGQAAMYASYGASASGLDRLSEQDVLSATVTDAVREHELVVSHYMATPEHFLWHARQAEAAGSSADFLSAVIVDEKSIWDYNRGISSRDGVTREQIEPPDVQLVAVYPTDGYFVADNPAVVLEGDWVDESEAAAASDFLRFAESSAGQAVVRQNGYRDLHGVLAAEVVETARLDEAPASALAMPDASVVLAVQAAFPQVRKPANVLFVLDVSSSMEESIPTGETKLEAAAGAIALALEHFGPQDAVGLAAFSSGPDPALAPGIVVPSAPLDQNRGDLASALTGLETGDDTPLYEAVGLFHDQLAASAMPDSINAIVLLSDGRDEPTAPTVSQAQMLDGLSEGHHGHGAPVLVFTLAFGADADVTTLQAIASATGAHYYDATDPTRIDAVLGDLVTSF